MANLRLTPRLLVSLNRRKNFIRLLSDEAMKRDWSSYKGTGHDEANKSTDNTIKPRPIRIKPTIINPNRVLTVPNVLTFSRIAVTPAMGYFIWNGMNSQALICFAYAAATDLVDGWIARTFNQDSDVGALLDPIADKILLTTCFVAMFNVNLLPLWVVKAFILRDLLILGGGSSLRYLQFDERPSLKKYLDFKNHPTIGFEPTFTSKCNTALQCLIILTHLSTSHLAGVPMYDWSVFGLHATTVFTSMLSLAQYTVRIGTYRPFGHVPKSRCM